MIGVTVSFSVDNKKLIGVIKSFDSKGNAVIVYETPAGNTGIIAIPLRECTAVGVVA